MPIVTHVSSAIVWSFFGGQAGASELLTIGLISHRSLKRDSLKRKIERSCVQVYER